MSGVVVLIGGQEYHGHTATRDQKIAKYIGQYLYRDFPGIHLAIGGTPGIPMDVARAFMEAGGSPDQVKAYVSQKYEQEFLKHNENLGISHQIAGETQEDRRKQLPLIPNLKAAIGIQGGKYTTHELKLFEEHKIPIIAVRGGGGACGGQIPWDDGYVFQAIPDDPILSSEDPEESPEKMAEAVVQKLK